MDEHVEIGGRYFDLRDTTFNLSPLGEGRTRLEIVAHYRVTSSINLYAVPVARLLGHDFIHAIPVLYKGRSERMNHLRAVDSSCLTSHCTGPPSEAGEFER